MNTDKVDIPVDLALMGGQVDQLLAKILSEFKARLEKELITLSAKSLSGQFPIPKPTVSGQQEFEVGGRKFQMTGKAALKHLPEQVEGEGGELDVAALMQFSASIKEVRDRLNNDMDLNVQRLKKFNESIKHQPLEIKKEKIGEFVKEFGDINNELTNRLEKIGTLLERKGFSELKQNIESFKPEDQIKAIDEYLQGTNVAIRRANNLKAQIQDKLKNTTVQRIKLEARDLPLDKREAFLREQIARDNSYTEELTREINRSIARSKAVGLKRIKLEARDLPLDKREAFLREQITLDNSYTDELTREINRTKKPAQREQFKIEKERIIQLPIEEQFRAWETYKLSVDALVDQANKEQGKLAKKFDGMRRSVQRTKFTDWSKKLQTMDPAAALAEMDRFLANTSTAAFDKFGTDVKIMRNRLQKSMQSTAQQMQKEKQRQFANMALIGAGAGLGLLGPAGFPLLNIGFAAMSGGPVGAGIAAFATGLGETSRVLEEYRQKTIETAKAISFIPTAFKLTEARIKGFEAVIGGITLTAQEIGERARADLRERRTAEIAESQSGRTNFWEALKTQFSAAWHEGLLNTGRKPFTQTWDEQSREFESRKLPDLEKSYRNALAQMMKPTVGIETDPYEVWKRMQTAAFDPTKAAEMEVQQKLIDGLKRNTEAIIEANKIAKEKKAAADKMPIFNQLMGN